VHRLLWLLPLLPFAGALANGALLAGRRGSRSATAWIACGASGLAALLGLAMIASYWSLPEDGPFEQTLYTWIPAGLFESSARGVADLTIGMGFYLDPLACVMLFVVTFVGFWIHLYSVGYMAHDEGFRRYFIYLNLFLGAMLLLVLGNNFLVLFVGWEGVGLCSYLLIGFDYRKEEAADAGRKAFVVNRIGDFGFLVGLFALAATFGSLGFADIFPRLGDDPSPALAPGPLGLTVASFAALCLFLGAVGKSAQIPLYVWLPDAMAGPTPVSALIHAATMVTAGVYMMVRANALYQLADGVSLLVAIVGCATAVFAATIGLVQTDIKKVLAYSTVSQLGYMVLAVGVGAYGAAVFHLFTHAFFKALLFLGAGSVIHALNGEQDLRKMGGLKKHLPVTYWTFLLGTCAISGVPLLSGFFSKDEILHRTFTGGHQILWAMALITAGLTACYMFRAFFLAFHGEFHGTEEQRHHLHEPPPVMTVPLVVLAAGAVGAGWLGVSFFGEKGNLFARFLAPVIAPVRGAAAAHHATATTTAVLVLLSVGVAAAGIAAALSIWYQRGVAGGQTWADRFPALHRLLVSKYRVDELYDATVVRGTWGLARGLYRFDAAFIDGVLVHGVRHLTVATSFLSGFFDRTVVDGLVNLVGWLLERGSHLLRRVQTGYVSQYALVLAAGLFALICIYLVLQRG
jgi:NADH-quinone oxidoreductase subunit L